MIRLNYWYIGETILSIFMVLEVTPQTTREKKDIHQYHPDTDSATIVIYQKKKYINDVGTTKHIFLRFRIIFLR